MKFTEEEIKEGEALKDSFDFLPQGNVNEAQYDERLTECAIIAQKMKVDDNSKTLWDAELWITGMFEGVDKWCPQTIETVGVFARMDNLSAWKRQLIRETNHAKRVLQYLESL